MIATPVPTHYALAKEALEAGKHVFVEKPPAMRGEEMEELVDLARAQRSRPDAGPPAPLPPRAAEGEGARRQRRARRCRLRLRQPAEPRRHPLERERALVARRPRPLGDPLAARRGAGEAVAHGVDYLQKGIEDVVFCFLRFPSGKVAHMHLSWLDPHKMRRMTVVGREKMVVFDDMELERKVTVYEKAPWEPARDLRRVATRTGDIFSPKIPNAEPLRLELRALPPARRGRAGRPPRGDRRARRRARARPAHRVAARGAPA